MTTPNPTLDVKAEQLRLLLQYAKRAGSVNAWAELAMRWIDLASEYIEETKEQQNTND